MFLKKSTGPRTVTLPDGRILTQADLPAPNTRWVASRKAVVAEAVEYGLLTRDEALSRYGLTEEELDCWVEAIRGHGREALKVTRIQSFRQL
ncbi:CtrA inhibitor SciP [Paracoccus aminophilus]|uniref:DUF1153 domain-containing protein n=1 Tax=Paracoccus aminophilus JCM 7686 TaxID=1367847 RepID=S5YSW0_PARAH|nr:DUF1153 domain-containing protein [Paracoccus aminophilus]AGT08326.1 hypothetical protein JCM7686_1217 [Paracoccus aminophilus JCM 7686]